VAGSVNKVILVGNLGNDPDIRAMQNGARVANLSIATSESWKDKSTGERQSRTQWHRVVIFNDGLVTIAERYLKKGSKVYLEGQLETRKWTGQDGKENYSTEVVLRPFRGELTMLDSRSEGGSSYGGGANSGGYANNDMQQQAQQPVAAAAGEPMGAPPADDLEDEIPF